MRIFKMSFLLFCLLSIQFTSIADEQRYNVLLIMVDDLTDKLGCYGDQHVKTPHIDKLAQQGVLFKNSYCQQALCNPSRSSMLTGMRPGKLNILGLKNHFRDSFPNVKTLPQQFREHGYFTARAGKIFHMGVPDAMAMHSPGKDDPKSWDKAINCPGYELNSNGYFFNATPWETHRVGTGGSISWLKAEKGDHQQHDHNVASEIIKLMNEHKDEPFFLAAGFIRPHVPFVAPKRFFELYEQAQIEVSGSTDGRGSKPKIAYNTWASNFNISDSLTIEAIKAYYACVSFVDEQVGRLMHELDRLELREKTIVVFVSDHGYQLGEHGLWFKNFLYRESAISPLIINVPSALIAKNQIIRNPVELLDIFPTVMELCNIPIPPTVQGESMVQLMQGTDESWKDYAFVECMHGNPRTKGNAIYTKNWMYAEWDGGKAGVELYDLKNDRAQIQNLAGKPQYLQEMKSLSLKIKKIKKDIE